MVSYSRTDFCYRWLRKYSCLLHNGCYGQYGFHTYACYQALWYWSIATITAGYRPVFWYGFLASVSPLCGHVPKPFSLHTISDNPLCESQYCILIKYYSFSRSFSHVYLWMWCHKSSSSRIITVTSLQSSFDKWVVQLHSRWCMENMLSLATIGTYKLYIH